jgi:hypothetical protein
MNNSRRIFASFNKTFTKSFFNNKLNSSILNSQSNCGYKFKTNFANKAFSTQLTNILNLSTVLRTAQNIGQGVKQGDEGIDSEVASLVNDINNGAISILDLSLFKDDSKWTCSTRLINGPKTPVQTQHSVAHNS